MDISGIHLNGNLSEMISHDFYIFLQPLQKTESANRTFVFQNSMPAKGRRTPAIPLNIKHP